MTQFVICSKERCWQGVSRSKLASCWNRRSDHQARATTDLADGMCLLASEVKKLAIGELNVSHPCPKVEGMAKRKTNSQTEVRKTWNISINSFRLSWGMNTSSQSSATCLQSRFNFPCADRAGMLLGFAG